MGPGGRTLSATYRGVLRFPPEEVARIDAQSTAEADFYLMKVQAKVKLNAAMVQQQLLRGNPAETLADSATKTGVDPIDIGWGPFFRSLPEKYLSLATFLVIGVTSIILFSAVARIFDFGPLPSFFSSGSGGS